MSYLLIIQARLTSSRFPKKVLAKIKNKTIIEIINLRLKDTFNLVFAIPRNKKNFELQSYLLKNKIPFSLGPEQNVLERFYKTALLYKAKKIIRITADCPLIDPIIIKLMILSFEKNNKIDYISNTTLGEKKYPDGTDVEIFKFAALKKAFKFARLKYDKEHVTPYIQRNFRTSSFEPKTDYSYKRWTIDTKQDLNYVKKIFKKFNYNFRVSFKQLIKKNF